MCKVFYFSELSGLGLYVKMDHVKAFNVGLLLLALSESPFLLIWLQLKTTSVVYMLRYMSPFVLINFSLNVFTPSPLLRMRC